MFAANAMKHGKSVAARLDWAMERALDRPPTKQERAVLEDLYKKTLAEFRQAPADASAFVHTGEAPVPETLPAAEFAAMANVTRAILNLHEMITRN